MPHEKRVIEDRPLLRHLMTRRFIARPFCVKFLDAPREFCECSQGSEYPAVVIPVMTQHYAMLQRNWLYTGVTRGKRLVVPVEQKKAVAIAVRNVSGQRRWSKLRGLLPADVGDIARPFTVQVECIRTKIRCDARPRRSSYAVPVPKAGGKWPGGNDLIANVFVDYAALRHDRSRDVTDEAVQKIEERVSGPRRRCGGHAD
jgi:hypothetical protein